MQTLSAAVNDAQSEWAKRNESGFGKAKSQFFSFLETMDSHKYLFSVIPNGEKYTSLITGIVTSVVKVSFFVPIATGNMLFVANGQRQLRPLSTMSRWPRASRVLFRKSAGTSTSSDEEHSSATPQK